MKKYLIIAVKFATTIFVVCLFFPRASHAQYNPAYNGGTYINQMIRDRMNARRTAARMASHRNIGKRKAVRKKAVRRKSRRVSMFEYRINPKTGIDTGLSKKSLIV